MVIILSGTNIQLFKISITVNTQNIADISRLIIGISINTANITIVIIVYATINDAITVNITRFMVNIAKLNSTLSITMIIVIITAKICIQNNNEIAITKITMNIT